MASTLKPADVHLSAVETAKRLRVELRRAFPETVFSVRCASFAGGSSLDVRYTDGPARDAVEPLVYAYGGRGFDGMTDSTYYNDGNLRLTEQGPVSYSCSAFLNVHRDLSAAALLAIAQLLDKDWDTVLGPRYINPREHDVMDLRNLDALTAPVRDLEEAKARALAICQGGTIDEAWPNGPDGRALVLVNYKRGSDYYVFRVTPEPAQTPADAACYTEPADEPDLCPEHGPHTADYCPGCTERRAVLQQVDALFSDLNELPDDITDFVVDELGKRGYDVVKRGPRKVTVGVSVDEGVVEFSTVVPPDVELDLFLADYDVFEVCAGGREGACADDEDENTRAEHAFMRDNATRYEALP